MPNPRASARLLEHYGIFAATERVMMELAKRGGDRQALHEAIREHTLRAWEALRQGEANPLIPAMTSDPAFLAQATAKELEGWLDAADYVGDAPVRARRLAQTITEALTGKTGLTSSEGA